MESVQICGVKRPFSLSPSPSSWASWELPSPSPWASCELQSPPPRPSSPPSSPPLSPPLLTHSIFESLWEAAEDAEAKCGGELDIEFDAPVLSLVRKGVLVTDGSMLRSEESVKESWETDLMPPITYDKLHVGNVGPSQRKKIIAYLESAKKNQYFEAPEDRPDEMTEGFYLICSKGRQDTTSSDQRWNFKKYADLVPKLGVVAVETHNFIAGSKLKLSEIEKANLFFALNRLFYFITLEAEDEESGKKFTCKSRVCCAVLDNDWPGEFEEKTVQVHLCRAESFAVLTK